MSVAANGYDSPLRWIWCSLRVVSPSMKLTCLANDIFSSVYVCLRITRTFVSILPAVPESCIIRSWKPGAIEYHTERISPLVVQVSQEAEAEKLLRLQ